MEHQWKYLQNNNHKYKVGNWTLNGRCYDNEFGDIIVCVYHGYKMLYCTVDTTELTDIVPTVMFVTVVTQSDVHLQMDCDDTKLAVSWSWPSSVCAVAKDRTEYKWMKRLVLVGIFLENPLNDKWLGSKSGDTTWTIMCTSHEVNRVKKVLKG